MVIVWSYVFLFSTMLVLVGILVALTIKLLRRSKTRWRFVALAAVGELALIGYVCWFIASRSEFDESRSRNKIVSITLERPVDTTVADQLAARLGDRNTLIAVSLSGGGSRAAYFSAAVLEQLNSIQVPGPRGGLVPLVSRIDVISTVSGGSLAGAYFAVNAPLSPYATDAEWSAFFHRFKSAMAHNYEADVARQMMSPSRAPLYMLGLRNGAETLADDFDRQLFAARSLRFEDLLTREQGGAPILIINTTDVRHFSPVAFTLSPPTSSFSPVPVDSFQDLADLKPFHVSDAVAASAAFPGLGWIRVHHPWTPQTPIIYLSDGGLVDNSGLISLYAHVYDRRLFELTKGRLRRIIVIAIDASSATEEYTTLSDLLMGVYERGQTQVQRFVLPEMLKSVTDQEIRDLLAKPQWSGFQFLPPQVIAYSDPWCRGYSTTLVPTAFRLSSGDRAALDLAAKNCVDGINYQQHLAKLIDGSLPSLPEQYPGILSPTDRVAWGRLYSLATSEYDWLQRYKQWATIDDVRAGKMMVSDPAEGLYGAQLDFRGDLSEKTGFRFSSSIDGDRLFLRATPVRYADSGWVSFILVMSRTELLQHGETDEVRFGESARACMGFRYDFHGGDLHGQPAAVTDPIFWNDALNPGAHCY